MAEQPRHAEQPREPHQAKRSVAAPFTSWQWTEVWVYIVVQAAALIFELAGMQLLHMVLFVVEVALLVHMATWMIPKFRARRTGRS